MFHDLKIFWYMENDIKPKSVPLWLDHTEDQVKLCPGSCRFLVNKDRFGVVVVHDEGEVDGGLAGPPAAVPNLVYNNNNNSQVKTYKNKIGSCALTPE